MPRALRPVLRWWAQRWVDTLASLGPEYMGRLQRAQSYARSGHVWRMTVQPGHISGQVLGSYGYYTSNVRLPIVPDTVWARTLDPLGDRPALLAELLADELPTALETILNKVGGSLFIDDPTLIKFPCSCPDYERPCKHALALCYDFATQVDTDPALLLKLAGHTVEELLTAIQERWNDEHGDSGVLPPKSEGRDLRASGFYEAGADLDGLTIPLELPIVNAALLYQLGKPPFASAKEDPMTPLARFYAAITDQAAQVLSKTRHSRVQNPSSATPTPRTLPSPQEAADDN